MAKRIKDNKSAAAYGPLARLSSPVKPRLDHDSVGAG